MFDHDFSPGKYRAKYDQWYGEFEIIVTEVREEQLEKVPVSIMLTEPGIIPLYAPFLIQHSAFFVQVRSGDAFYFENTNQSTFTGPEDTRTISFTPVVLLMAADTFI